MEVPLVVIHILMEFSLKPSSYGGTPINLILGPVTRLLRGSCAGLQQFGMNLTSLGKLWFFGLEMVERLGKP